SRQLIYMIPSNVIKLIIVVVIVIILAINQKYFTSVNKLYKTITQIPKAVMLVAAILAFFGIGFYNPFQSNNLNLNDILMDNGFNYPEPTRRRQDQPIKDTSNFEQESPLDSSGRKYKRNVTESTKKLVAANQQWKCAICGCMLDETYEVDHVNPLYKGGSNDLNNLMALDPICHRKKTNADRLGLSIE